MVSFFIFYLHIIGVTFAFTSEYQKEGVGAGLLNVGFTVLIFSVGWSICTLIMKYLIDEAGFGPWFNRDALALIVLTVGEAVFYYFYYKESAGATSRREITSK